MASIKNTIDEFYGRLSDERFIPCHRGGAEKRPENLAILSMKWLVRFRRNAQGTRMFRGWINIPAAEENTL